MSQTLNTVFLNDYYHGLGAKFIPFAGYSMPINFSLGIIKEHQHTRSKCGLFDISHMGQMLIPYKSENAESINILIFEKLKIIDFQMTIADLTNSTIPTYETLGPLSCWLAGWLAGGWPAGPLTG